MFIVEPLPAGELEGSIVLHVRAHCRGVVRSWKRGDRRADAIEALALLFGLTVERARELRLDLALDEPDRIAAAAERIARGTGAREVALGHDGDAVALYVKWLERRAAADRAFDGMFANDPETLLVFSEAMDLATATTMGNKGVPIMICGETGTGKEMLANAIHQLSAREKLVEKSKFVPVFIAGMPPALANDELFGHVSGAFTDAKTERVGKIELASGGTLLIDEVGDLGPEAQVRLLRALQEGKVERTGGSKVIDVQVRILSATNRDIEAEVREKRFRLDLLHRLRHGWLLLPPLRDRPGWEHHVVDGMLRDMGYKDGLAILRSARDALTCHEWPGNLRELRGALEVATASAAGAPLRVEHLPRWLQRKYLGAPLDVRASGALSDDLVPGDAGQLAGRVEHLREEIEATVVPVADEALAPMIKFHESIPDRSVEHATTLERLLVLQQAVAEETALEERRKVWSSVAQRGLPLPLDAAVREEIDRSGAAITEQRHVVEAQMKAIDLANDPWWKLVHEIGVLPIFDEETRPHIQAVIVWVTRLLTSVAPEFAEDLFARIRSGGLNAVRVALRELTAHPEEPEQLEATDIGSLTAKDWRGIHREHPRRVDAARALDCDTKTISKYAAKALGRDPWAKKAKRRRKV